MGKGTLSAPSADLKKKNFNTWPTLALTYNWYHAREVARKQEKLGKNVAILKLLNLYKILTIVPTILLFPTTHTGIS